MVNPSGQVDGNMKSHKPVEDPHFQMQEYMKHSADFQRRLLSVRESRALLEKSHRMQKERASHMGFQFKQISWQMRRAQDDAYLAQERYLKLLQLEGGHDLRSQKGNSILEKKGDNYLRVTRVAQQSDCQADQVTSHQNEHQNHDAPTVHHYCAEDLTDLDLIQGTSFRFFTAIQDSTESVGRNNGDAQEIQSYLTLANCNTVVSREGRLMSIPQQESRGELGSIPPAKSSNVCEKDDFVSTSFFVCGNLDSQDFLLEQRKKATDLLDSGDEVVEEKQPTNVIYENQGEDQGQEISLVQESDGAGNNMKNSELDLPVSIMPTTPMMTASPPWDTQWRPNLAEENELKDVEKKSSEDVRKPFLKIQKSGHLSQRISKELEDVTKNSSLACYFSKPTTTIAAGDAGFNNFVGSFEVESTPDLKSVKARGDTTKSQTTQGQAEGTRLKTEEKRKIMKAWHPEEKLGVLATITNTMFLWEVEHSSNQQQHYGSWPECEPMISAAHAARGSQQKLFDFLETERGSTMSRPMICCGAVCELLKAYPPEKLLPFRFIDDFFASESKEVKDHGRSQKVIEGLTFDHLEVYQEEEDTKFWQMLVHHAVSVKDHTLASFREIARIFVEILLPSTRTEDFPAEKIQDLHQDLLQFLVSGFRSKTVHLVHAHCDDGKHRAETQSQVQQTGVCDRDAKGFSTGYRSGRSNHLRPVSSRKGLLSCFGSMVRTKFRIWRLKTLSRGVDTVDDAVVCLLRSRTQETAQP